MKVYSLCVLAILFAWQWNHTSVIKVQATTLGDPEMLTAGGVIEMTPPGQEIPCSRKVGDAIGKPWG